MTEDKITHQEKLERIKQLKGIIKEKSKQIDPNKSYTLEDLTSGAIVKCPNQVLLNEINAYQIQLDLLLKNI